MIRRIESDGTILIITQPAHAWLSGQIAERWGNANFPTPEPREALLLAAYCHDAGWAEWEAMPRVRSDGRPPNFTEMEVDDQLANWRRGIRIANSFNSYAAMLVALHATALLRGRLAAASDPAETRNHIEMFLAESAQSIERFTRESRHHPRYGSALPASPAPKDFVPLRMLQLWDLISLLLCGGLSEARHIENVPTHEAVTKITLSPIGAEMCSLSPWPFGPDSFTAHVDGRRLTRATFESDDDFRAALAGAEWQALAFTFVRGG